MTLIDVMAITPVMDAAVHRRNNAELRAT